MEAGAQHAVERHVGSREEPLELVTRRPHQRGDARAHGTLGNLARKVAGELIGLDGRDHLDVHAMGEQGLGGNPAVSPVIAHAGKNHGVLHVA